MLHQVVAEHWAAFVEHTEEQGRPLPSFVQREVEAYLRCGILEHGLFGPGLPGVRVRAAGGLLLLSAAEDYEEAATSAR